MDAMGGFLIEAIAFRMCENSDVSAGKEGLG
jgi:hypothetical protein